MARECSPAVGFSWGFEIRGGEIRLIEPQPLSAETWTSRIGLLETTYPGWGFIDAAIH